MNPTQTNAASGRLSAQLQALAERREALAIKLGAVMRRLPDGSWEMSGGSEALDQARKARALELAAEVVREMGL